MKLNRKDLHAAPHLRQLAKSLYESSFPREERIPWLLLWLNSCRHNIDLTAWLDGERFCGFTASVTVEDLHFVLFLAIPSQLQGKGYGSEILSALRAEYGTVELNVETLTQSAPNYPQRQRRFAFYRKNGFYDTGYHVWEVGGKFRILSTDPAFNAVRYKKVFRKLTFGLWNVRVEKAEA